MPYRIAIRHTVSHRVARIPAVTAVTVGAFVAVLLAGWLLGLDDRPAWRATALATKANAAAALLFEAAAMLLLVRGRGRWAACLLVPAVVIAAVSLVESFTAWDAGIDRVLAADAHTVFRPGQMSPLTAICLLFLAAAQYCAIPRRRGTALVSQILALALLTVVTLALLGHLYEAPKLYHIGESVPMSTPTALALVGLAFGALCLKPQHGVVASLALDNVSGRMGRRLLVVATLGLPALAWLRIQGQALGLYDTAVGSGLVVTAAMLMFVLLVGIHTRTLGRSEDRIQYLNRVYSMLSDINSLIVRTATQQELLADASRIAVERGGFPRAWFGLVDADHDVVRLAGKAGDPQQPEATDYRLSLRAQGMGYSPIGLAVHTRQPVVSNDVAGAPPTTLTEELLAHGIRSYAVFPLLVGDRVLGIFKLHAEVPHFFHAEELKLLAEMAGDVAFAIQHLEQKQTVDHLAYFDALTGLANARLLEDRLHQAVDHAMQMDAPLALAIIDIMSFKMVNDAYGRHVGDEALRTIARRLVATSGDGRCARLGSNLFAVLMPGLTSEGEIAREHERIMQSTFSTFDIHGRTFDLAARAGIAMVPVDGTDPPTLLRNAEAALESARIAAQRYRFHAQSSDVRIAERLEMRRLLSSALAKREFALHYQAKVDSRTTLPVSAEALLRWNSAEFGAVSPGTFVPILEETGIIEAVGLWVLCQVARDSQRVSNDVVPDFRLALNVSASQLLQPDFVDAVAAAIGPYAGAAQLDVEITESLLMHDVEDAIIKLRRLREMGFKIAIDDFGTGYSSMSYLARLPLDYLKIDRSFVTPLPGSEEAVAIVTSIIGLAHALNLGVIAEGVETATQATLLIELGCDQLQGYYYARPEPLDALLARLRQTLPQSITTPG